MILNLSGIPLFPVIDEILQVHDLEAFIENDLIVPEDLLDFWLQNNWKYECYLSN